MEVPCQEVYAVPSNSEKVCVSSAQEMKNVLVQKSNTCATMSPCPITSEMLIQNRVQDVRVDNWGNYCLQRLQAMHERGDFCDLTLQFSNLETLRVSISKMVISRYEAIMKGL